MAKSPNALPHSSTTREVSPISWKNTWRFTRLTNAFSKKVENLRAAVSLHFTHYNFVRLHKTLRITPAMATGVENRLWTIEELVEQTS